VISIVHPAPYLDTLALVRAAASFKPAHGRLAQVQVAGSDTVGFVEQPGGRLLAALGFWPLGNGREEVFLVGLPAADVGPHLVALSRLARLTLAARLHSGTVAIIAHVQNGNRAGERLARLAGFSISAGDGAPSSFQRWELSHGRTA